MTGLDAHPGDPGTLEAVKLLEQAMEGRTEWTGLAAGRMAAAVRSADEILATARAAGTEEGRQRVSALVATATAEAAEIRTTGTVRRQKLRELVHDEHRNLVTAMTAIVLGEEG